MRAAREGAELCVTELALGTEGLCGLAACGTHRAYSQTLRQFEPQETPRPRQAAWASPTILSFSLVTAPNPTADQHTLDPVARTGRYADLTIATSAPGSLPKENTA